jgi:hypothetical protein
MIAVGSSTLSGKVPLLDLQEFDQSQACFPARGWWVRRRRHTGGAPASTPVPSSCQSGVSRFIRNSPNGMPRVAATRAQGLQARPRLAGFPRGWVSFGFVLRRGGRYLGMRVTHADSPKQRSKVSVRPNSIPVVFWPAGEDTWEKQEKSHSFLDS